MLIGAAATATILVGLFFFRFWRSTCDRFFLFFAASFWIEGLNRILMGLLTGPNEDTPGYYLIRLVAYGLIVIAILDKNRPSRPDKKNPADRSRERPASGRAP
jgi:hypothetical protein